MIKSFIIYDTLTGREKRRGSCPEHMFENQARAGERVVEDPMYPPVPFNVSGTIIDGLPVPCTATLDGVEYHIDDGTVALNPDMPGHYYVHLAAPNYSPSLVEIVVP